MERVLCVLSPGDEGSSRSSGGCGRRYGGSALSPGSFFPFDRCSVDGIQKIGL